MRSKIIILIIGIIILSLFSLSLREKALNEVAKKVPEYNCGENGICTSCIIDGNACSCGRYICDCGNKSVDRAECDLISKN